MSSNSHGVAPVCGLKLPFEFDSERLLAGLERIRTDEWVPHYNERDFGGVWSGVALRSGSGSATDLIVSPAVSAPFRDTPLLDRHPVFREVLERFPCTLKAVRLLVLAPGSFIREHSDNGLGFEDGEVRIHVPIKTNPSVEFYVCGERMALKEGGCYYLNVNLPHRVSNRGTADRVHLVIDAEVDDWVREIFAASSPIERSPLPPHGIDDFRALVFSDEAIRVRLQGFTNRYDFSAAAVAVGREHGFDLHEADVEASFRAKSRLKGDMAGWVPIRVTTSEPEPMAEWLHVPGRRFTEPFFEDSVRAALRDPLVAFSRCEAPLQRTSERQPNGLIFHMSRCGSTLVSRTLAMLPQMRVVPEAPAIDQVLATGRIDWLRDVVGALGAGPEASYVIKLDAWHIHQLPLLREAFPEVPWIFVYRDPLEVMVSHARQPGMQMIPKPEWTGTRQEWCEHVLEGFLESALRFRDDPKTLFVDYKALPGAIWGSIARHFGLGLSEADELALWEASQQDAKNPNIGFTADSEEKRREGERLTGSAGAQRLARLYSELTGRG